MWKVQLFKLNYDQREADAIRDVVESGWITMGEKTREFERDFEKFLGDDRRATALSSATASLHIALLSLGVGSGDEVIIPALTFVADINVVRAVGATPKLADCGDYNNWNVTAESIKREITNRTKAVIIVHFAGYPCDMDEIVELCQERGVYLIEDVAHAVGATYRGESCGTFGEFGCFSFFTNKNLSVGEGGMLVTGKRELERRAKLFRSHGMSALTLDRHKGRAVSYDVELSGFNYRIDDMRSALGVIQLSKLKDANRARESLVNRYIENLKDVNGLSIPFQNLENITSSYHIFVILLDRYVDREEIMLKLKEVGVQSSIHYPPFREFTAFKDIGLNPAPIAEDIAKRELTLPLYPTLSVDEVDFVCENLKNILGEIR
ncbi:MAG: DegT/DnrJ/EryC1/StrS family aminotransferase [Epsilonproteobacteria bacterium]|nr:DegT/DnrJ/EryC1/StrS family aminotransferase [Campylobacterota bacterium]